MVNNFNICCSTFFFCENDSSENQIHFCKHQFCDIIRLFCILGFYCISTIFNESGSTSGLSCHEQRIVHYLLQNFIDVVYMTRLPISTQIVKATFPCQYDYIKHQMIQCTYLDRQIDRNLPICISYYLKEIIYFKYRYIFVQF